MAQNKINKLELTWIGKEDEPLAVEPRILLDSPEYSFGDVETGTLPNGKPWPGNMLIHGDNLLTLCALEEKVRLQRHINDLKKSRSDKHLNLYQAQDDVDSKKEELLSKVEAMFAQKIEQTKLETFHWGII